jgi:hypothetical protein
LIGGDAVERLDHQPVFDRRIVKNEGATVSADRAESADRNVAVDGAAGRGCRRANVSDAVKTWR